jgi:hypothetical protein
VAGFSLVCVVSGFVVGETTSSLLLEDETAVSILCGGSELAMMKGVLMGMGTDGLC